MLVALAALTLSTACKSKEAGNQGNFYFSYYTDDQPGIFNKPIAITGFLDVDVTDIARNDPVTLTDAFTADPSIIEVAEYSGSRLTLLANSIGTTLLNVEGVTSQGETLPDDISMTAAEPEVLRLRHTCNDTRDGYYLTSSRVLVPFEMERRNGQPVIGYGVYPVSFSPQGTLIDFLSRSQAYIHLDTDPVPGEVTMSSDIDGESLTLHLIEEEDFDGAVLQAGGSQHTRVGDSDFYYVLPTVNGNPVCQADANYSVASSTPSTCMAVENDPSALDNEFGWFEVTGLAAGTCTVAITYPNGNGGAGLVAELDLLIQQ